MGILNPTRAVEAEFTRYFKETTESVETYRLSELPPKERANYKRRLKQLHPSSFPYCSLRHAYETLLREEDPVIERDFGFDYFVNVGTTAHSIFQHWMGKKGQVLGNWRCENPECGHEFKLRAKPKRCLKCKHLHLSYHEAGGKWGARIFWHKDGIFKDKHGKLWIIDYKTSSSTAIWNHKKSGNVFPYMKNRVQIESYVVLAEDLYQQPIEGWILLYASRDFPHYNYTTVAKKVTAERKAEVRARMTRDDTNFGRVLELKENPEYLKVLRKQKLCDSPEFYKEHVFDKYDPCPLSKHCFTLEKHRAVFEKAFKGIPIKVAS
jgi:hypothetical protein